jgi:hypothetical protein
LGATSLRRTLVLVICEWSMANKKSEIEFHHSQLTIHLQNAQVPRLKAG